MSCVRNLGQSQSAEEDAQRMHASTIAAMDAAISDLRTWKQEHACALGKAKSARSKSQRRDVPKAWQGESSAEIPESLLEAEVLTAGDSEMQKSEGEDIEDPFTDILQSRLQLQLLSLQEKRKRLERGEGSERSARKRISSRIPADILISKQEIERLTQDDREHFGDKSVEDLKADVRRLEVEIDSKRLHSSLPDESEVEKTIAADTTIENIAGLSNILEAFTQDLDDALMKLDIAVTTNSSLESQDSQENF